MAIKNKIKEKKETWDNWNCTEPCNCQNIVIGDLKISVKLKKGIVQFVKGSSVIEFSTNYVDDLINFLAEEV